MFTKLVFVAYLKITAVGIEDDGTINYLLETPNSSVHRMVSYSSKEVLPYKLNEYFLGQVEGECSPMWRFDGSAVTSHLPSSWLKQKKYICNADTLKRSK